MTLDKPVFIGQAVLDLSKLVMYRLKYNHLAKYAGELGGNISVVADDTDSFFLELTNITTTKLLEVMARDDLLDSSNYPHDHPLYLTKNKARLGCAKGKIIYNKFY